MIKIILSVFLICSLTLISGNIVSVYANQDDIQNGELIVTEEFKKSEIPKPILTYKIPYSISNGTIVDALAKPNCSFQKLFRVTFMSNSSIECLGL